MQLPSAKTWALPGMSATTSFVYDGDGGRVKVVTSAGTTTFLGASYEIAPTGTATKYVFAGSQRIAAKDSTGALRFYHGDHLGSSNVITDAVGTRVELAEYTPYGSLNRREGTANVPQKFTGKRLDPTGLYFYEARYYDPGLGRFVQADTIVPAPSDPQALNRYSYVRNNPLKYTDPTGHGWFSKFFKKFGSAILQTVGVLAAPFTGGASLWLAAAGTAWSGIQAAQAGQFGAWAAGFAVSAILGGILPTPSFENFFLHVGVNAARGAAIGALSGGLASLAGGGSFGEGAGYGALGGASGGAVTGIAQSQQYQNWASGNRFASNQNLSAPQAAAALAVSGATDDPPVKVFSRNLEILFGAAIPAKHPFMQDWEGTFYEMSNVNRLKHIFQGPLSAMTRATQKYMATNPVPDEIHMVYGTRFKAAVAAYKAANEGQPYHVDKNSWVGGYTDSRGFPPYVFKRSEIEP